MIKMYIGLYVTRPLFLSECNETWFFFLRQFLENYWNTKFHENPSSGSPVFPCGRTDGHDETNSRFRQFCECS